MFPNESIYSTYGAAHDDFKIDFLRELVNPMKNNPYANLIGEDFNLLRFSNEESRGRFDNHWPFLFNVVSDRLDM